MESELLKCAKVWLTVLLSLCYCYMIGHITHKGSTRLFCVVPVVCLFFALPLNINSVHLGGTTSFYIAWLANFKLLLFAFGKGPLCSDPSLSLGRFVALACMPIKIQNKNGGKIQNPSGNGGFGENPDLGIAIKGHNSILNYAVKGLLLGTLIKVYDYSDQIHPKIILFLYCFHIYFCLEIILAVNAAIARRILGIELEPQFDEPYRSTSLQDFWGRRWNLMVTSILRPTVYEPVRDFSSRAVGRSWAVVPAVMATFLASAMMHELIFYHFGRVWPTWEITCFFLLHGSCLVAEIAVKRVVAGKFRLPGLVSGSLTIVFVMVTGFWLFFPQLLRCKADVRAFEEYAAVGAFVRQVGVAFVDWFRSIGGLRIVGSV